MICPYYENSWCNYALEDEELSCQPALCTCQSEGDVATCQFGFASQLEEEVRQKGETQ